MIVFEQPKLNKSISNKVPYTHKFKAWNNSNSLIKEISVTTGCSCTKLVSPKEIPAQEEFYVEMTIDKVGITGLYSVGAIIEYDNGDKIRLNLNGKLLED